MSSLSQFAPFAAGGLKSFQTGYVSTNSLSTGSGEDLRFFDVTISSVNTAKAIPGFYGAFATAIEPGTIASYTIVANNTAVTGFALPRLTSSTNLRLSSRFTVVGLGGRWQIAEAN